MDYTTVYQYFAANGALIYVGITNRGTRRLHEHADSKPWWHLATGCTLEHFDTREAALVRESTLIERYRPPYNTQHNPERNVPLQERAATRLRLAGPDAISVRPKELKKRRERWYQLDRESQLVTPCVECQQRPGITGPSCIPCRQLHALMSAANAQPTNARKSAFDRMSVADARELMAHIECRASTREDGRMLASEQRLYDRLTQKLQGASALDTPTPPETPERVANSTPERILSTSAATTC